MNNWYLEESMVPCPFVKQEQLTNLTLGLNQAEWHEETRAAG